MGGPCRVRRSRGDLVGVHVSEHIFPQMSVISVNQGMWVQGK